MERIRILLILSSLLLMAMPVAFLATFLLLPFWSWIEAAFGVEAVGHSGPADWCFFAVYALLAAIALGWFRWRRRYGGRDRIS